MDVNFIFAVTKDGGIGLNNSIPWKSKEEMERFKQLTLNKTVVMGRKTFESIGKFLKDRKNVVVTRKDNLQDIIYSNIDVFIIGGAEIYKAASKICEKIIINASVMKENYLCETFIDFVQGTHLKYTFYGRDLTVIQRTECDDHLYLILKSL